MSHALIRLSCCTQNAIYQSSIYLYNIATGPHEEILEKILQFAIVSFNVSD